MPAASIEFEYAALGRGSVLKPAIEARVYALDGREFPLRLLPDSGADCAVFPLDFAEVLGVDLAKCKDVLVDTGDGLAVHQHFAQGIRAVVGEHELQLEVRFARIGIPVLGRKNFFEAFKVLVDERERKVVLTPHP